MTQLRDVNTRDIPEAIRLGCRTMQRIFDADDHDIPFFACTVRPEVFLGPGTLYQEAHVPGRHLHALLLAEALLGISPAEDAIEKHARAAFFSFSGPVPFPLNRPEPGAAPILFADHNLREGLHALHALVKYRNDAHAREIAAACIEAVFDLWNPETGWDRARLEAMGVHCEFSTFIWGPARSIGPLVKYYQATGHGRALELARLIAEKATAEFFRSDGAFDPARFGTHTHSTTCALSGLALLGGTLNDTGLLERVNAFCNNGLRVISDETGWVMEHAGRPDWNPDRGECNNTGDVIEARLILGRHGYPGCWHAVERALRAHLLPAQLRDIAFIATPPNPLGKDGLRDVARRSRGAFGFPAPYGHEPIGMNQIEFCMDIVGGAVSSLCEAWRDAVTSGPEGHRVNLLFDRETETVRVESPYTHDALRITVKKPGPLWVRLPSWVDRHTLRVEGTDRPLRFFGEYGFHPAPTPGQALVLRFAPAENVATLQHATREIRVRWRGDEVAAMDGFGADLTFFEPF